MQTANMVDENIKRIGTLFPNCLTERLNEKGQPETAIDFDQLRQELSKDIVDGPEERYQFTWPDKRNAIRLANAPTTDTLRPCREDSVDFDTTQNLYIEGDNLQVLKLLRENYLGKVKMIYIDPPYNTGNDFVYNDNFDQDKQEYVHNSGQYDEDGYQMVPNTESNGRFHTDWLNMIYPRLKVAKDLLSEDGVIFISIDDNEVRNLKNVCDEVFGESNFYGIITWSKKRKGSFLSKGIISLTEYLLVYSRNKSSCVGLFGGVADSTESQPIIKRTNKISVLSVPANIVKSKLEDGLYKAGIYGDDVNPVKLLDDVIIENGIITNSFRIEAPFVWSQTMFNEQLAKGATFVINTMNFQIRVFRIYDDDNFKGFGSYINGVEIKGTNEDAYEELESIFGRKKLFDYSKPTNYIGELVNAASHFDKESIILDFFSGSATTAHAVMQLNAEDGGKRKFIMVQLPEATDEKSEAYKAGYKNICEIGKERIRRAGKMIKDNLDNKDNKSKSCPQLSELSSEKRDFDTGFRVLKLDSSNMDDVYYTPAEFSEGNLFANNIKLDRTEEDLLFQTMIELGIELSAKIEQTEIAGKTVWNVADGYLLACFDEAVNETTITEIAKQQPYYFVMRDSTLANDQVADNFEQIFEHYSKDTIRRIL